MYYINWLYIFIILIIYIIISNSVSTFIKKFELSSDLYTKYIIIFTVYISYKSI